MVTDWKRAVAEPAEPSPRPSPGGRGRGNRAGTILLAVMIVMLLLAVTAITLNRQTAMRVIMATNVRDATQARYGQLAVMEQAVWRLTSDAMWRTGQTASRVDFAGTTFELWVTNAMASGYADAIVIACRSANGTTRRARAVRYIIDTAAGSGNPGSAGDGGAATTARLNNPRRVVGGLSDEVLIADTDNHQLRRVSTDGVIRTIAGTGTSGYSGDGGAATSARLNNPCGMWMAADGDLYCADRDNHLIRMISAQSGRIYKVAGDTDAGSPVAGNGWNQFKNPRDVFVVESSSGRRDLYVTDTGNHRIRKVSSWGVYSQVAGITGSGGYNGDGIAATTANLNGPSGLWITDDGVIYIADSGNYRIRAVSRSGIITTIAGNGMAGYAGDGGAATSAKLSDPRGLAVDPAGNLFIADAGNSRIRVVSVHDGKIYTVAGGDWSGFDGDLQPAVPARLKRPRGVALLRQRGARAILIADTDNHRIRRLTLESVPALY